MADVAGEADIRGIDIDKLAKGFGELFPNVLKQHVHQAKTKAREIRYYLKTAGFLDTPTTEDTTVSLITNVAQNARPFVAEQSWTRDTAYVKKFMVESPLISMEDIKDNDIDIMSTNVRDLTIAVQRKIGLRIFQILFNAAAATPTTPLTAATTVQTSAATAAWTATGTMNPILDILNGKMLLRIKGYNPEGSILAMNSIEHKYLISYLINVKGSSIPAFSSEKVKSGVVMELLGCNVLVDEIFTTTWVYQFVSDRAATWKSFLPITAVKIVEPLIGTKIRIAEEGECILHDPNAVHVISGT